MSKEYEPLILVGFNLLERRTIDDRGRFPLLPVFTYFYSLFFDEQVQIKRMDVILSRGSLALDICHEAP